MLQLLRQDFSIKSKESTIKSLPKLRGGLLALSKIVKKDPCLSTTGPSFPNVMRKSIKLRKFMS